MSHRFTGSSKALPVVGLFREIKVTSVELKRNEKLSEDQCTFKLMEYANWGPAEDVDNHTQSRPGTPHRRASARLRKEKAIISSELAQDRRTWRTSIRDVINSVLSLLNPLQMNAATSTSKYSMVYTQPTKP